MHALVIWIDALRVVDAVAELLHQMPCLVELSLLLTHLRADLSDVRVKNLLLLLQQHLRFHLLLVIGCLIKVFSVFVRLTWLTGSVHSCLLLQ